MEPKAQCRACLTHWEVGIVYCTCGHFLKDDPKLLHQERPATRSQVREERRLQRIPHGKSTSKEVQETRIQEHSRSIYPWSMVQKDYDRNGSL